MIGAGTTLINDIIDRIWVYSFRFPSINGPTMDFNFNDARMQFMTQFIARFQTYGWRLSSLMCAGLFACSVPLSPPPGKGASTPEYVIGAGDTLQVFVWRNPEVSISVPVRPDGKISTPLVEDMIVTGKTPSQLARDIEKQLSVYLKDPAVTVIVTNFVGPYTQLIRVVGAAGKPQTLQYRAHMTVLDVMIQVGGLTDIASGNKATLIRRNGNQQLQFNVRLDDLIRKGDITANADMLPGDILIIPESWF